MARALISRGFRLALTYICCCDVVSLVVLTDCVEDGKLSSFQMKPLDSHVFTKVVQVISNRGAGLADSRLLTLLLRSERSSS